MIRLVRQILAAVNLESMRPFVGDSSWFYAEPGVEHHRLLAYLSTQFEGRTIFDIGTHLGDSAHALAYNPSNIVHSFDVTDQVPAHRRKRQNISYHLIDLFDPSQRAAWKGRLLDAALIFIDVDPHDGDRELELVRWLLDHAYEGIIVLDDIWHFKPMRDRLWSQIEAPVKIDATLLGHWSGTGIVSRSPCIEIEGAVNTANWTLVTGYFDLTQMSDATLEIKARSPSHYLDQHAQGTLGLDQNLVVFTDPDRVNQIWSLRPRHLHAKTRVVPMRFEDFPLTKHRDQILANRGGICQSDPRNTASYYLFCMARYAMMKRAIEENNFGSSHFAWINICMERMGYQNLVHLSEALGQQRDKFSTCYIDYVDKQTTQNLAVNFGDRCTGRCTMCSGFFTGDTQHMKSMCDLIERQFVTCLEAGYGHADEQLINLAYFEAPELFDWYLGDYQEMITNYAHVRQHPEKPLRQLITRSYAARDWKVCARACDILWRSHQRGTCHLADEDLLALLKMRAVASAEIRS